MLEARTVVVTSLAVLVLAACGPADQAVEVVGMQEAAIHQLTLGREEPRGTAPGFDLDGWQSNENDGRSCFQADFVDADGRAGVDNQLAVLMPLIDIAGEGALESLVQQAINEGRALMVMQMRHMSDGTIDLTVKRGEDTPLLGTDGRLLPGQTLGLNAEQPLLGHVAGATMKASKFRAGPMDLELPVVVFSNLYVLNVQGALIEADVTDDGRLINGRLGGAVSVEQVLGIAGRAADQTHGLEELLGSGIRGSADMGRGEDGACTALSMGVTFGAVPVFTFE